MLIKSFSHELDLLYTSLCAHAGSELCEDQRSSKSGSVFASLSDSLVVKVLADFQLVKRWFFAFSAHGGRNLAAVGVIIQDLHIYLVSTTWSFSEASRDDERTHGVRELGSFEEHDLGSIVFLVDIEAVLV